MVRKISLSVVLVVGVVWVVATFAMNLWPKAPAADHLTNALKPAFTNAGIAQEQSDAKAVSGVVTDLNTTTVPLLASLTHQSNGQVVALVSKTFPTVGKLLSTKDNSGQPFADGKTYLQHASYYITTVANTFAAQQHNYDNARQIPTNGIATVGLVWLFMILGLVVLVIGGLFIWRPSIARPLGAALMALGLVVVAVTFVLDVPGKTQSVDSLTNAFRPVFSTTGPLSIDQGQDCLNAVAAADTTLTTARADARDAVEDHARHGDGGAVESLADGRHRVVRQGSDQPVAVRARRHPQPVGRHRGDRAGATAELRQDR